MPTKIMHHDGLPIEVTDQAEAVINKLSAQVTKLTADHAAELATVRDAHSKELATRDATISDLQGKVVSDADMDARISARAALVADAVKIVPDLKHAGLSDADVRKAVVLAKCGDAAVNGKDASYIGARFDVLKDAAAGGQTQDTDPAARALAGIKTATLDSFGGVNLADAKKAEDDAYKASVERLKGKKAAA